MVNRLSNGNLTGERGLRSFRKTAIHRVSKSSDIGSFPMLASLMCWVSMGVLLVCAAGTSEVFAQTQQTSVLLEQRQLTQGVVEQGLALAPQNYFGATSNTLYRFDTDWNLETSQRIQIPGVDHMGAIDYHDGFIWAGFLDTGGSDTSIVARIDATTLQVDRTWDISACCDWIDPVTFDGTYLWVGEFGNLGLHRYRLDENDDLIPDGILRYPSAMSFSQGVRTLGDKLYTIHTFDSMDGLFEFEIPDSLTEMVQQPTRVWPIQETIMHLEGFDFIAGTQNEIWHAQSSQVDRYSLDGVIIPAATGVRHDWVGADGTELENSGSSGAANNAVLINNGADPSVSGAGTATVVNGTGFGTDDGYIDLGNVAGFTGADYFEVEWKNLDLNVSAATDHVLAGALAPGTASGSQSQFFANGCSVGGACDVQVILYESGGEFLVPDEVTESVNFQGVLPDTRSDLRIVFEGNGQKQAAGGSGTLTAFVNGTQVGNTQNVSLGVVNPDEKGASFGLGKYHNGSSLAGDYTTGTFMITFEMPVPLGSTWTSDSGGDWHSTANWDGAVPTLRMQTVTLGDAIQDSATVFVDLPVTVNSITFASSNTYNIAGTQSISLNSDTSASTATPAVLPSISVAASPQGSHQFQTVVNLLDDTTVAIDSGATLEFVNLLNLNGNTLTKTGDGTLAISNTLNTGGGTVIALAGMIEGVGSIGGDLIVSGSLVSPGISEGGTSAVPEPSCLLLIGLGVCIFTTVTRF